VHVKELNDRLPTVFGLSDQEWFLHIYVQCTAITDEGNVIRGVLLVSTENLRKTLEKSCWQYDPFALK
jgi:hypothetical protein